MQQLDNANLSWNGLIPAFSPIINLISIVKQNIIIKTNI